MAAGGRVLDGVFENDQQETPERGMIRGNSYWTGGEFTGDLDALGSGENGGLGGNLLDMENEVDITEVKISGTGIGAGQG